MAETFYTLLTKAGQGEFANATTFGTKVNFTKFKVGDGNGAYYEPTETQTDLVNVVWTGNVQAVSIDPNNSNWIVIEAIIPTSEGGFTIREMGIYDDKDNLLAISKCAETYKPVITDGSTKELWMKMVLVVTNTSVVNLKIDPSIIFATKKDLENLEIKIEGELDDFNFQTAGGTATAIILKVNQTLENGLPLNFVASFDNNGQATTVNGKPLYKPATNPLVSPKLKTGKGYTIWYNSNKDCFFIKASAEGTATKDCVLAGYTFSSDDDIDIEGIIVNNGALNYNMPINGTYTIPAGYTSGGTITQNIPVKNAQTYIPTTTDQTIPLGQYLKGNQIIKGDSNLTPDKIASPFSIFGVQGTATPESLGGKIYQIVTGSEPYSFTTDTRDISLNLKGKIDFEPDIVFTNLVGSNLDEAHGRGGMVNFKISSFPIKALFWEELELKSSTSFSINYSSWHHDITIEYIPLYVNRTWISGTGTVKWVAYKFK